MSARAILLLPLLVMTAGCVSLGGGKTPPTLMTLTADASDAPGTARNAAQGEAISILVPSVPTALGTPRVPVQLDPANIAYVKDAQWVDVPARLFRNLLAETVSAKNNRMVLDLRQYGVAPGVVLNGRLNRFGYDVPSHSVVVSFDGTLKRADLAPLETKRFEAKVASGDSAGEIGVALNQAANRVASDVADWVK